MKRYVPGLNQANGSSDEELPDGLFLVRVARLQYRWHAQKPYYVVLFTVLEPKSLAGNRFSGRLYCTVKALWKLNWFLRDFGYDPELIGRDEIDDQQLVGLSGIIKITHTVVKATSVHNLDGFAPASQWEKLSAGMDATLGRSKVSRDL
jgi:hypothetical protein